MTGVQTCALPIFDRSDRIKTKEADGLARRHVRDQTADENHADGRRQSNGRDDDEDVPEVPKHAVAFRKLCPLPRQPPEKRIIIALLKRYL